MSDVTPTYGELAPIIRFAARQHGVRLCDSAAVEQVAVKVLVAMGYHPGDAASNAHILALLVYESPLAEAARLAG